MVRYAVLLLFSIRPIHHAVRGGREVDNSMRVAGCLWVKGGAPERTRRRGELHSSLGETRQAFCFTKLDVLIREEGHGIISGKLFTAAEALFHRRNVSPY